MVIYDEVNIMKQKEILSKLIDVNTEVKSEYEAHKIIQDTIREVKSQYNLDNFSLSTYIKDTTLVKWKSNPKKEADYFVKIFYNEINHAKEIYGLTNAEISFLYQISQFVAWESNLLIDEEGKPMSQKVLCEATGMDRKKVYNNTKSLETKKCLLRIYDGRDVYYMLNPNLCYKGQSINKGIPKIFSMIGYVSLSDSKNIKK